LVLLWTEYWPLLSLQFIEVPDLNMMELGGRVFGKKLGFDEVMRMGIPSWY
jgi:hypothetical protein